MTSQPRKMTPSEEHDETVYSETEHMDSMPLYNIAALIVDSYHEGDVEAFLASHTLHDLVDCSQSNHRGVYETIASLLRRDPDLNPTLTPANDPEDS